MTTQTPPEKCPVCGAGIKQSWDANEDLPVERMFLCGSYWSDNSTLPWRSDCPHAMAAALRCAATLTGPTLPAEVAAVVEAAVKWKATWDNGDGVPPTKQRVAQDTLAVDRTDDVLFAAVAAYLAPRP